MSVTVDTRDLDRAARGLAAIAREGLAVPIVEGLADIWVDRSQARAPVDTGQLKARTAVAHVGGSKASAVAEVVSDVPYAGYVEFGTAFVAPNPYFRAGLNAAEQATEALGGRLATQVEAALKSGGSWNPRRLIA